MGRRGRGLVVALLAGALATCGGGDGDDEGAASPPTSPDGSEAERMAFVFTFFRGEGGRGVHLAVSTDGLEFREVNDGEAILTSELGEGLTRDPSILLGPDERWHMVWTSALRADRGTARLRRPGARPRHHLDHGRDTDPRWTAAAGRSLHLR